MTWEQWAIDASMGYNGGMFCLCPIEGDLDGEFNLVTGMNYLTDGPPPTGKVVAILHPDGQQAVEAFCAEYDAELKAYAKTLALGAVDIQAHNP